MNRPLKTMGRCNLAVGAPHAATSEPNNDSHSILAGYPDVLNTGHISEILGTHPNTTRALIHQGIIPGALRIGRKLYVPRARFIAYLAGDING